MSKMKAAGRSDVVIRIIVELMKAPANVADLALAAGVCSDSARSWLEKLRTVGLVRQVGYRKVEGLRGSYQMVYEWQSTPFAKEDFAS